MEAVEDDDDSDEEDTEVRGVGLEGSLVRESIPVDSVVLQPSIETNVCDQDEVPRDEASDRGDVNKPVKHCSSVGGDVEVSKRAGEG